VEQRSLVKIGIAWDSAFCFYYQDNLDRLRLSGAELVFFSPLHDRLPDVQGLYIGGGYPELHLETLSSSLCRTDIARAADAGMPVYGECGGLMYLTKEISADRTYRLCGLLPATTEMTTKVQALGYVQGQTVHALPCFPPGLSIRGHEFHYSRVIPASDATYAFTLQRGKGIENGRDGLVQNRAIGTFTHAYFSRDFARYFIQCCAGSKNMQ
jgi:cobyrinic acid a,c-diamide synthase